MMSVGEATNNQGREISKSSTVPRRTRGTGKRSGPSLETADTNCPPTHKPSIDDVLEPLTDRQRVLVAAYTNPESTGYLSVTKSAEIAQYGNTRESGRAIASETLHKPTIRLAVDTILDNLGLGIVDRAHVLKDIVRSKTSTVTNRDGQGNVTSTTESPNTRSRLQAIAMLNRLDGSYSKAETVGHAQGRELSALMADYGKRLRAELKREVEKATPRDEGGEGVGTGGESSEIDGSKT